MFIPLMVYGFGLSQHRAQGTSLALMLPPLGLLATLRYYKAGYVDFGLAGLLALGFFIGAPFGAMAATALHPDVHMIVTKHGA